MSDCPTKDRLLLLLDDGLPEGEHAELAAHLEACPQCRGILDRLAARSGLWDELPLLRDEASCPDTHVADEEPGRSWPDDDELPLGLFDPPDEPEHLGKLGPYDVIRPIGRGGMGLVFLAKDRALDRLVAIKILTPGLAATAAARRRFAREAKAAAAVVHEHVVTIHAVDALPQGVPYLVMQYVAGKSVQDVIDRGKTPGVAEILRIGSQAASALAAAHAQGLIHRDIKPANILLENGVERVKITDFGLARAVDDATLSQSGVVAGTPQYMSPEQAGGEPVDHRTDLFSLGSVLYALCTGQAAFRGSSSMATLRKVCEQRPRPIQELNPEIPSWLVRIIETLHAKDPEGRYGSAAEVADLLCRCLAHVQQPSSVPLPAELRPARKRRSMAVWGSLPFALILATILCWPGARQAAGQAVSYMGTVLRLTTPEGTLVVEADDPDVGIKLDGSELVITTSGLKELRLSVGKHNVQALKDGKLLREELVTISRGGRTVLRVRQEKEPETLRAAVVPPETKARDEAVSHIPPTPASLSPIRMPPQPGPSPRAVALGPVDAEVRSLAFSPDGRVLAFGTRAGRVGLWDWQSQLGGVGAGLYQASFDAHPGGVESVAISPDGRMLVTGGHDNHVKLWDLKADPLPPTKPTWDFGGFDQVVRSVAFSPDGNLVAAGGFDRVLALFDAKDGRRVWTSPILDQPVNGIAFSPDGQLIALALGDWTKARPDKPIGQPGEVQVWNWPGRERIATMLGWKAECKSVAFDSTGKYLAATGADNMLRLYECDRGSCKDRCVLDAGPKPAGVAFRPGSLLLASGNRSGQVKFWSAATQGLADTLQAHPQNIPCIAFSPDGRVLATAGADGMVKIWFIPGIPGAAALESLRLAEVLRQHPPEMGRSSGWRMQIYLRDLAEERTTLVADEPIPGQNWCSNPDWSHDGTKILFNASTGMRERSRQMVLDNLDGHPRTLDLGPGRWGKFSPDDRRIVFALAREDETDRPGIWVMNPDGTGRSRLDIDVIGAPSFSEDGRQLLINTFEDPASTYIHDFATKQTTRVEVPGLKIFSWPRWAGLHTLVASLGDGSEPESIGLLDVQRPGQAHVEGQLWRRSDGPDTYARWPLYDPPTGACYFLGARGVVRSILKSPSNMGRPGAIPIEGGERPDGMGGLTPSPGGRYLLFNAHRPDQAATRRPR